MKRVKHKDENLENVDLSIIENLLTMIWTANFLYLLTLIKNMFSKEA